LVRLEVTEGITEEIEVEEITIEEEGEDKDKVKVKVNKQQMPKIKKKRSLQNKILEKIFKKTKTRK